MYPNHKLQIPMIIIYLYRLKGYPNVLTANHHTSQLIYIVYVKRVEILSTILDSPVICLLLSIFIQDLYLLKSIIQFQLIQISITDLVQVSHLITHVMKEGLEVTEDKVLLDWIVYHTAVCPIDAEICVLEYVVVKCSYEISTIFKPIHIDIIDHPGGQQDDEQNEHELASNESFWRENL